MRLGRHYKICRSDLFARKQPARVFSFPVLALLALSSDPVAAQDAQQPTGPVEVAKYVDIQPGQEKTALTALQKYRAAARAEGGNSIEMILEEAGRPSRFLIVEKWKDVPAYKAHLGAPAVTQLDAAITAIRRAPDDERANSDFLAVDGNNPPSSAVFVVTHVDVNPPNRPKTEDALKTLVDASRKEDGDLAFNVYRPQTALNHFTLFEVWGDSKTFEAHGMAPAAATFRHTVAPLIGALYDERIYRQVE